MLLSKRLTLTVFAFSLLMCKNVRSQTADPVLLTVDGNKITKSEFERVFKKNNTKDANYDEKSVREYMELYINYKLKVREAEALKMDTSESFITELNGYKKQLAQPYLTDKDVSESLIKEAYDRMKTDVRASHVLIKLAADALPKDTLEAYKRAMIIRNYVMGKTVPAAQLTEYETLVKSNMKLGKTSTSKDSAEVLTRINSIKNLLKRISEKDLFATAAHDLSDDPSAKDNSGDLGFFTSMQMVYPFETAAYTTKQGQVSMPVRTRFGYHLVKPVDSRPDAGEIHTAHIMIKSAGGESDSSGAEAKKKIDEIYGKLKKGEKWEDLAAQYSEDKGSAKNGGTLPWFGTGKMVPEFEKVAFELKNDGDYSVPFKTSYGWHIVKRLEKKPLPTFEEKKNELKNAVTRDNRNELSKTSLINRIKAEYKFKDFPKNKDEFIARLDSNIVNGTYDDSLAKGMSKPLFQLGEKSYTEADFAAYLKSHQTKRNNSSAMAIGNSMYDNYINESIISYEESQLDKKYPEFKALMQEYRDGILLFDLTDKMVWSKAVKDSTGLADYYSKNKNNYMWGDRCEATVYTCANADVSGKLRKLMKKGKSEKEISDELNKESSLNLSTKYGKFSKGDNDIVDTVKWEKGISADVAKNNQIYMVDIKNILGPEPKSLDEAKGLITADYQSYLEKSWIAELRKKYPVSVDENVLSSLWKK